jgi:hypothetical protein
MTAVEKAADAAAPARTALFDCHSRHGTKFVSLADETVAV